MYAYFALRWVESGRIPVTNFFEAANFLGMGIVLVFLIMEFRYKIAALGSFMLPLVLILMIPHFGAVRQDQGNEPCAQERLARRAYELRRSR